MPETTNPETLSLGRDYRAGDALTHILAHILAYVLTRDVLSSDTLIDEATKYMSEMAKSQNVLSGNFLSSDNLAQHSPTQSNNARV